MFAALNQSIPVLAVVLIDSNSRASLVPLPVELVTTISEPSVFTCAIKVALPKLERSTITGKSAKSPLTLVLSTVIFFL